MAPWRLSSWTRGRDVFSFGTVLYELLSGRLAVRGENSIFAMAAILHTEQRWRRWMRRQRCNGS